VIALCGISRRTGAIEVVATSTVSNQLKNLEIEISVPYALLVSSTRASARSRYSRRNDAPVA